MSKQQFAKVSIGYRDYALPFKQAVKLIESLDGLMPVETIRYELEEIRPELRGRLVYSGEKERIAMQLVDEPLPAFDQAVALMAAHEQTVAPEILPYTLTENGGKYEVRDENGLLIFSDYSYRGAVNAAKTAVIQK